MPDDATSSTSSRVPGIKPPGPLLLQPSNSLAQNYKLFKQKWENYEIISDIKSKPHDYQVALLLHAIGDDALKVYNGFSFQGQKTTKAILDKFKEYAVGQENETHERFLFNKRVQNSDESFEAFLSALRELLKTCNFCEDCQPSILRDRIVIGIRDKTTQELLLRERQLTITQCINICKAAENASEQSRVFREEKAYGEAINVVKSKTTGPSKPKNSSYPKPKPSSYGARPRSTPNSAVYERLCQFCNTSHVFKQVCVQLMEKHARTVDGKIISNVVNVVRSGPTCTRSVNLYQTLMTLVMSGFKLSKHQMTLMSVNVITRIFVVKC